MYVCVCVCARTCGGLFACLRLVEPRVHDSYYSVLCLFRLYLFWIERADREGERGRENEREGKE